MTAQVGLTFIKNTNMRYLIFILFFIGCEKEPIEPIIKNDLYCKVLSSSRWNNTYTIEDGYCYDAMSCLSIDNNRLTLWTDCDYIGYNNPDSLFAANLHDLKIHQYQDSVNTRRGYVVFPELMVIGGRSHYKGDTMQIFQKRDIVVLRNTTYWNEWLHIFRL